MSRARWYDDNDDDNDDENENETVFDLHCTLIIITDI